MYRINKKMKVFQGDVEIPCVNTRQRCSQISLTRTGKVFKLTVPRPLTIESKDCLLFNVDKLSNKGKRVIRAVLKQNAHIQVIAVDKKRGAMFNRGSFTVIRSLRTGRFILHRHSAGGATRSIEIRMSEYALKKNPESFSLKPLELKVDALSDETIANFSLGVDDQDPLDLAAATTMANMFQTEVFCNTVNDLHVLPRETQSVDVMKPSSPPKHVSRFLRALPEATLTRFMKLYYGVEFDSLTFHFLQVLSLLCGKNWPVPFKDVLLKLPSVRLCHSDIIKSAQTPSFKLVLDGLGVTIRCRSTKEWAVAHNKLSSVLGAYGMYTKAKRVRDGRMLLYVYTLGIMPYMQIHFDNELKMHYSNGSNLSGESSPSPMTVEGVKLSEGVALASLETSSHTGVDPIVSDDPFPSFFDSAQVSTAANPGNANRRRREWQALKKPEFVSIVVQNSNFLTVSEKQSSESSASSNALTGPSGSNALTGPSGSNALTGPSGSNALTVPSGSNALTGPSGSNALTGPSGSSSLTGPSGSSSLTGPSGSNALTGPSLSSGSSALPGVLHIPGNGVVCVYGKSYTHSYANNTQRCSPTEFNGTKFRSRLEARCADMMTRLGVHYLFESIKMRLDNGGWYTPDFWLPGQQIAIEIKPCYPHLEEISKCESVSRSGLFIVLMYGNPGLMPFGSEASGRTYAHSTGLRGISWQNGKRLAGDTVWVSGGNGEIRLGQITDSSDMRWNSSDICAAIKMVPTH